jgi:hypothetical protein
MRFCGELQQSLSRIFPGHRWQVAINPNPGTSVIILSHGEEVPGEFIVTASSTVDDTSSTRIFGGQAFCDFLSTGRSMDDFARDAGSALTGGAPA